MRSGPRSALRAIGSALAGAAVLGACSLSLENPEDDARKKLATLVPATFERLEGRWLGDSTYTIFDTEATALGGRLVIDFFPDSTAQVRDPDEAAFPAAMVYRWTLSGDSLAMIPIRAAGKPDTFTVKLRFLGNWLELSRASDHRIAAFHRLKPFEGAEREALLDSGLWVRKARRAAPESLVAEPLRRDFDYLAFPSDSLVVDTRRSGISRVDAGPLAPKDGRWAWSPGGRERLLHIDLFHADTLRLWPLDGGRPDSGYSLYVREKARPAFDLDLTAYVGHLRADTVYPQAGGFWEAHYGRFYDLVLGGDYKVATLANASGLPRFAAWSVDAGALRLAAADSARIRFRTEKLPSQRLRLVADSGAGLPAGTALVFTVVDGSRYAAEPLRRFDSASYLHLSVRPDTAGPADSLAFYFRAASRRATPEEHEIAAIDSADTAWAAFRMDPALDPYGTGHAGFLFAFSGRVPALGRFTCRSVSGVDLAIRRRSLDAGWVSGLVQGRCRVTASEKAPPGDSLLALEGDFKSRRRNATLAAPFWTRP